MFAPAALLTIATVTAPLSPNVVVQQPSQRALQMGVARSDTIAPRDTARWTITVASGEYVEVEVRQLGVDVVIRTIGPDASQGQVVDASEVGGTEHVRWIANAEGDWTVAVLPFERSTAGQYEIEWVARRQATAADRSRVENDSLIWIGRSLAAAARESHGEGTREGAARAIQLWSQAGTFLARAQARSEEAATLVSIALVHQKSGRPDSALAYYRQALSIQRSVGDRSGEAVTLNNLATLHHELGRPDSALAYHARVLPIRRAVGDRLGEAVTLSNIGVVHSNLGRRDSALAYYAQALPIRRAVGDRVGEATTLLNMAIVHHDIGRPDSALAYYTQALTIQRAIGDRRLESAIIHSIAKVHHDLSRPDSALAYYAQALRMRRTAGDRQGEAETLASIGAVHAGLGAPDSAHRYYAQSLLIVRAVGARPLEAATLHNIANLHHDVGRPDSALSYYARALAIKREIGDRAGEATTLNGIGAVHDGLGRPDSALTYYARALAIQREVGDRAGEATTLSNIGNVHADLSGPDSALVYLAQALPIRRAVGDRSGEATTLVNIGAVHVDLGRPDSALVYFTHALAIQQAAGDRPAEAATLNNIGAVHGRLGRPDSSLAYYARALPIRRAVGDRAGEAATLSNTAHLYQWGMSQPRPRVAIAYFDSAAAALAAIATHAGGDQNRLSFAEQGVHVFRDWSLAWLSLARDEGGREARLGALAAAERGRAQAMLDLMRRSGGGANLAPPTTGADLAAEGEALVLGITHDGTTALSYLVTRDTLIAWLMLSGGVVHVFRTAVSEQLLSQKVAVLRRGLGADSAAVRARVGIGDVADLEETSRGLGVGIDAASATAEAAAKQLSEWLLPPELRALLPDSGSLLVLPHGPLNLIPFAALPVDGDAEPLGSRYALRYSPSLATLTAVEQQPARSSEQLRANALVVGNPRMPAVRTYTGEAIALASLTGAEIEGRRVAEQMGAPLLTGDAATEATVKGWLPSATLVHLATHGYAYSSEARARDSFIALAPTTEEDGMLTVGEVLDDLPALSAELVVLSACQTGLGDLKQAEGTVGLQRAFLAKGARSVLVSLWSVSDEATTQLMKSFYTHWVGGASKAEALRRAQGEVRGEPGSRFHHPRFWAAFQLVGAS
jgi:CHAT domain-containing protein/tetratricopeptide (TPR) repeat protein